MAAEAEMELLGATVLITGATGGIGKATAGAFAAEGARLIITSRSTEKLEHLASSIGEDRVLAVGADLCNSADLDWLVKKAEHQYGGIDILVNNAGVGLIANILDMSTEDLQYAMQVNFLGPLALIQKTVPLMKRNGGGIIINVSSMITRLATTGNGGYRATKLALDGLSDAVRLELKNQRIRVISVYPGLTKSDFFNNSLGVKHTNDNSVRKFNYTPEQVAQKIIYASIKEPRAVYMGLRGKLGGIVSQLLPGLVENIIMAKKRFV